ncbi:MAG: hypothetical protein FWC21_05325 [Treponema sp.]|nr:hypothetical protein [Treponema sp.]
MKRRFFITLVTLVFSVGAGLFAQNREYIPYVTQIQAEVRNNLIRLTWTDSKDALGPVFIFRSTRPFSGVIPPNIRPVTIRYGEQFYIDDTDDMENLYYFIAASDTAGRRYDIILPGINSTSLFTAQGLEDETGDLRGAMAAESAEGLYNLTAEQSGDRIIITFETAQSWRNAIMYRSTQPINRVQDLLNAVIIHHGAVSPSIDLPVAGISFYYAVIFEDEIASGDFGIKPGINATVTAVTLHSDAIERGMRPIPLPTLNTGTEGGFFITEIPNQIPLSGESLNILGINQMPPKAPLEPKRPRVFSVDLIAPTGGEESVLFQIVIEYFVKFDWENARINLQHYLSLPRSREAEARARFYLGQSLYYSGYFREALMEFLAFRSFNSGEANKWIDAVLTAMVY